MPAYAKDSAEFKGLLAKPGLTVVDFTATWCPPCKMVAPKYDELAAANGDVQFLKVDVDDAADIAQENEISAMPTFLFFKDGKRIFEVVGADIAKVTKGVADHK